MTLIFNRTGMKERRRELRRKETVAEDILWDYLKNRRLANLKFRRQYSIGAFVVDFYCPWLKLAIEIDGGIHKNQVVYDNYRQKEIEQLKIKFLRFTNEEIETNILGVLNKIKTTAQQREVIVSD
jgi:very-short-patch-repair endonuclease